MEYRYAKMKLITNIQPPFLTDILLKQSKDLKEIKAAVAYCKDYKLFEYCKRYKIKLNYYGRLDSSINLNLKDLKNFLTDDISIHIIGGAKFHPKIIWCYGYGAYIGSANLTQSAWKENIECGLWLTQKELKDNHLIDSLNDFFTFIQKESKLLSSISDQDILELNKHKQDNSENSKVSAMIKRIVGNFEGCSKKEHSNIKPQSKKNFQSDQQISANKTYKKGSGWSDVTEMMCLLIFKKLEDEGFPIGRQTKLCKKMAKMSNINLIEGTINAKVGNYKSVAGVNNPSHASMDTKRIYKENHKLSIKELTEKIQSLTKYEFRGFGKK